VLSAILRRPRAWLLHERGAMTVAASGNLCSRARLCALWLAVTTGCGHSSSTPLATDAHDGLEPAPGRRALAVIADFAGTRLEDWQGPGYTDVAQIEAQLADMTDHWRFLRRGLETIGWTLVRVQLPETLDDVASATAFRADVVALARAQIDPADYDFDRDGVLDTVWIIAATGGHAPPWLRGDVSRDGDANVFVDGQDTARVTGELDHDVARTRGLPDLHGTVSNIGDLSLMASSARQPPNDFSAYDRMHLGWLAPHVVPAGASTIDIADANTALVAYEIPTAHPEEYFLLEYRRRATSGYASAASLPAEGIVVYHVLETSDQDQDPPLLCVDRILGAGAAPAAMHAYTGRGAVFTIDAVRPGPAGSLEADVTVQPLDSEP
jgi:hypothetical protein